VAESVVVTEAVAMTMAVTVTKGVQGQGPEVAEDDELRRLVLGPGTRCVRLVHRARTV